MVLPDAFTIDERYDRFHASDRRSRYGVYLAHSESAFDTEGEPTHDPAAFAAAALLIGLPPVMSPPYAKPHRRVLDTWSHTDDDGRVAVAVSLAVPLPTNAVTALGWHWRSWTLDGRSDCYAAPEDNDRPAAYAKLTVRVPLASRKLPKPRYHRSGKPHLEKAKEAVHLAVVQLNGALGELLGALSTRRAA